ncbi:unnamed protein product, partial [Mesorhabditis belari]|uniref:Uncharacterized protein n=1 Tax=Mesorhabditis belari TaxID=2138241 RepID=A0AAF3EVP7_9BILA
MRFDEIDINKIVEESLKRDKEMEDLIEFEDRASVSEDELYELDGLRTVKPSQQVTFRVFDSSKRRNSNRRTWSDLVEFGELAQSIGTEIVSNQDIQAERCLKDSVVISSYKSIISPTNETAV